MTAAITARGVRVHNLKGIDVRIPTRSLVVLTGVSGSGKSSLAFDTLYAEGQRRYVESLSVYARQFLERLERPQVDSVEGICPAVALRQRVPARNPRSTVATATEIHDHLRVLFARAGETRCRSCGEVVRRQTIDSIVDELVRQAAGRRLTLGFPWDGPHNAEGWERLRRKGFLRVLTGDGGLVSLTTALETGEPLPDGPVTVVVDRVKPEEGARSRLADSVEGALAEGEGVLRVFWEDGSWTELSDRFECRRCDRRFEAPHPRLFSFNSPFGACPTCHGFGNLIEIDHDLVVPDKSRSLDRGAIEPWNKPQYRSVLAGLRRMARRRGIPMHTAWEHLSEEHRRFVLEGDEDFHGVVGFFRWLETKKYKVQVRVFLSRYRGYQPCPACGGSRLRREALDVQIGGLSIDAVCRLPLRDLRSFLGGLTFAPPADAVAGPVIREIEKRVRFLADVGLDYLELSRPFGTLSGGEAQRIGLATALGTGLVGTLYVLDEPSVGLHPRDTDRLVATLKSLRDQGNTVLVVEHDRAIIEAADHVIDLGPGAGEQGGRIIFQGSCAEMLEDGRSLTGKFLRNELRVAPRPRRRKGNGLVVTVRGARAHNLKNIDVRIPLGTLTCVTGVSGSGKSTLVHDVLYAGLMRGKGVSDRPIGEHDAIDGASFVDEVILVDQSPIGRSPRSNPVTYLKAFDAIREVFSGTKEAQERGLSASHFSFNVEGGRCEACSGDGQIRVDMQFLADVYLVCDACGGRRYRPPVLEVRYRGRTIDQVLEMTIHEAVHFFSHHPKVVRRLKIFEQIGLGYLRLGQPATTLSGGEAQRVKLAAHLLKRPEGRALYILDEPTTGLHMGDVRELLDCFERLIEAGATLLVIEHNMDVVKQADWVIDLGPEGGASGGNLVFQGTPEALVASGRGATGPYLQEALAATLG